MNLQKLSSKEFKEAKSIVLTAYALFFTAAVSMIVGCGQSKVDLKKEGNSARQESAQISPVTDPRDPNPAINNGTNANSPNHPTSSSEAGINNDLDSNLNGGPNEVNPVNRNASPTIATLPNPPHQQENSPETSPQQNQSSVNNNSNRSSNTQSQPEPLSMANLDAIHFDPVCAVRMRDASITPQFDFLVESELPSSIRSTCQRPSYRTIPPSYLPRVQTNAQTVESLRYQAFSNMYLGGLDSRVTGNALYQEQYYRQIFGHGSLFFSLFQNASAVATENHQPFGSNIFETLRDSSKCDFLNLYDDISATTHDIYRTLADGDSSCTDSSCRNRRHTYFENLNTRYLISAGRLLEKLDRLRVVSLNMCDSTSHTIRNLCTLEFSDSTCNTICSNPRSIDALRSRLLTAISVLRDSIPSGQNVLWQARQIESIGCARIDTRD